MSGDHTRDSGGRSYSGSPKNVMGNTFFVVVIVIFGQLVI
jgi:hypothetical protein